MVETGKGKGRGRERTRERGEKPRRRLARRSPGRGEPAARGGDWLRVPSETAARAGEGRGVGGGARREGSTLAAQNVFSLSAPTAERTAGGVVWAAAGSRPAAGGDARPAYAVGGGAREARGLQVPTARPPPPPPGAGFTLPGHRASSSRPRVSACRRAETCARRPARPAARPLRRGPAGCARALHAWSCQGHGGRWVGPLCISKQRAHLSAPLPAMASLGQVIFWR